MTIILGDTLTRTEQTLVEGGAWPQVEAMRLKMQELIKDELIGAVEKHTGRKVIAFVSANHCNPDLAVESFVLGPA